MNNSILVFGGGDNQVPLIQACKELGYFTIVTDPNTGAPGAALADLFVPLPPKDLDAHRALIQEHQVGGIVTCQMENPLLLMAELAKEFGLLFPAPEVIQTARNKYLMKQAFLRHDVACAKGILITNEAQLHEINFSEWVFPLIIKPSDSYSSRGVFRVMNEQELYNYYVESVRFSSNQQVLVEEFLEGPEVSVESITYKGKTTVVQITDKVITPYPHTVELAHYQPSTLPADTQEVIKKVVAQAIDAIGIDNCGSHAELKITPQGPKMIEIGARLGGDYITSHLTYLSTGVNMNRAIAQVAMGEAPDLDTTQQQYAGIQYINWSPGKKIKEVLPLDTLLSDTDIVHAGIFFREGDTLPEVTDSAKRHSFIITKGTSKQQLLQNIEHYSVEMMQFIHLAD